MCCLCLILLKISYVCVLIELHIMYCIELFTNMLELCSIVLAETLALYSNIVSSTAYLTISLCSWFFSLLYIDLMARCTHMRKLVFRSVATIIIPYIQQHGYYQCVEDYIEHNHTYQGIVQTLRYNGSLYA